MRLCAVMVVYGQLYTDTITYRSLVHVATNMPALDLDVVIYDNSAVSQQIKDPDLFRNLIYYHDPKNLGVVPAYIFAKDYCVKEGIPWLLRLDQDSSFDQTLIQEFLDIVRTTVNIKAIVPKVFCKDMLVSPSYTNIGGLYSSIPINSEGVLQKRVTFINSMSFICVAEPDVADCLDSLLCQLDLSDHEFASQLPPSSVFIMRCSVNHSLSIKGQNYVSKERYLRIIKNELLFMKKTEGTLGRAIFRIRLIIRTAKFMAKGRLELAAITFNNILK